MMTAKKDQEFFFPDVSTTPNGSVCSFEAGTKIRYSIIKSEHEQETLELQLCWVDLWKAVRCLYGNREENITEELNVNRIPANDHVIELVHKLCSRDPHQLFLRLESQVQEFVIRMKEKLLKQLSTGFKTPPQAKEFISLLLEEYAHLSKVARKMTGLLKELQNHLKRFKVTWDLHNKHLFQSICFSEPSIKNCLNLLISQLRLGAASKEAFTEDTYPNLLHRYLKFEDEMSVINVVWRDCHQLIESYNEEQSAFKLKQNMLREDWNFKTQRKLFDEHFPKSLASLSRKLDAKLTSQDKLTCPRCNRKRCPCDECTITHMITCGSTTGSVLINEHPLKQTETKPEEPPAPFKCDILPLQGNPVPIPLPPTSISPPCEDLLEKKGLDELIKYINGTEEDDKKPLSAKAAKRARQKQRKAEEKAKQEAEKIREELERERLRLAEERRIAEEAERKKNESLTKKQRKQAARRAKSSSNSPTPVACDVSNIENDVEKIINKNKKKGKHKDELPALQVNITCEFENGSETVSVSSSNHKPVCHHGTGVFAGPSPLKTIAANRPSPQGGHAVLTPPSIDNRIVINSRQTKTREIQKSHVGNGDTRGNVTISKEQMSQMTPQHREFIQKKTQQFIQMKLQEERQRQQLQQQQHQSTVSASASSDKSKKLHIKTMQNEKLSVNQDLSKILDIESRSQTIPLKNNVRIAVKTSNSLTPNGTPRLIEQNNNVPRQGSGSQSLEKKNEENELHSKASTVNSIIRRGTLQQQDITPKAQQKQSPQVQRQNHVQSLASQDMALHANHTIQQNGTMNAPVKCQTRQAPTGQSQNGKISTPKTERKQEQGKSRQEDSPPSDQLFFIAEEAERKKNRSLTKKQRKQAARRAKSSSNSPTPVTCDSLPGEERFNMELLETSVELKRELAVEVQQKGQSIFRYRYMVMEIGTIVLKKLCDIQRSINLSMKADITRLRNCRKEMMHGHTFLPEAELDSRIEDVTLILLRLSNGNDDLTRKIIRAQHLPLDEVVPDNHTIRGNISNQPLEPEIPAESLLRLTSLSLCGIKMEHDSLKKMVKNLSRNVRIENINLSYVSCNHHQDSDTDCTLTLNLQKIIKLTSLCLYGVNVVCDSVNCSRLQSIKLYPISKGIVDSYIEVFNCIKDSPHLERLEIYGSLAMLEDNTVESLTSAVKTLPKIKSLKLSGINLPVDVSLQLHCDVKHVKIVLEHVTMSKKCIQSFISNCVQAVSEAHVELDCCTITPVGEINSCFEDHEKSVNGATGISHLKSWQNTVRYICEYVATIPDVQVTRQDDCCLHSERLICTICMDPLSGVKTVSLHFCIH